MKYISLGFAAAVLCAAGAANASSVISITVGSGYTSIPFPSDLKAYRITYEGPEAYIETTLNGWNNYNEFLCLDEDSGCTATNPTPYSPGGSGWVYAGGDDYPLSDVQFSPGYVTEWYSPIFINHIHPYQVSSAPGHYDYYSFWNWEEQITTTVDFWVDFSNYDPAQIGAITFYAYYDSDVIPEPSVWAFFLTGFGLCGYVLRRAKRAAIAG